MMEDASSGMTEREAIAYRRGFDDGLAAMREKIKDLLLENDRLRRPLLDGHHPPKVNLDVALSRICVVNGGEFNGHAVWKHKDHGGI
ncbi:MAG: hypothetical protein HYZ03_06840 [candidate division NC10 bacterium]|nr:hypothetical protein [candidate division NC10 bacterium]